MVQNLSASPTRRLFLFCKCRHYVIIAKLLKRNSNENSLMLSSLRFISIQICRKRPGVATTMSGVEPLMMPNCCSIDSPPRIAAELSPVNLPNSRTNLNVYKITYQHQNNQNQSVKLMLIKFKGGKFI